jgi:hypothetical protein
MDSMWTLYGLYMDSIWTPNGSVIIASQSVDGKWKQQQSFHFLLNKDTTLTDYAKPVEWCQVSKSLMNCGEFVLCHGQISLCTA